MLQLVLGSHSNLVAKEEEGEEEGKFAQENGLTEGSCLVNMILLCSKYSIASRWQQVVVFSVVFECCMIILELCTDVETVSGRT